MRCWRWRGGAPFRERESERDGESEVMSEFVMNFNKCSAAPPTFAESQIDGNAGYCTQQLGDRFFSNAKLLTRHVDADCAERD